MTLHCHRIIYNLDRTSSLHDTLVSHNTDDVLCRTTTSTKMPNRTVTTKCTRRVALGCPRRRIARIWVPTLLVIRPSERRASTTIKSMAASTAHRHVTPDKSLRHASKLASSHCLATKGGRHRLSPFTSPTGISQPNGGSYNRLAVQAGKSMTAPDAGGLGRSRPDPGLLASKCPRYDIG